MNIKKIAAVLLLSSISVTSYSDFVYSPKDALVNNQPPLDLKSFALVGTALVVEEGYGNPEIREGYGNGLPIGSVLMNIKPKGWKVFGKGVDFKKCLVSFAGGKTWTLMLEDIMKQAGTTAVVSWPRKILLIKPDNSITNNTGSGEGCERSAGLVLAMDEAGFMGDGEPRIFILRKGQVLSEEIVRWGKSYNPNWFVSWEIDNDYEIKRTTSFKGTFSEAVSKVVDAYQRRGGMKGIAPTFSSSNRTVSLRLMRDNEVSNEQ